MKLFLVTVCLLVITGTANAIPRGGYEYSQSYSMNNRNSFYNGENDSDEESYTGNEGYGGGQGYDDQGYNKFQPYPGYGPGINSGFGSYDTHSARKGFMHSQIRSDGVDSYRNDDSFTNGENDGNDQGYYEPEGEGEREDEGEHYNRGGIQYSQVRGKYGNKHRQATINGGSKSLAEYADRRSDCPNCYATDFGNGEYNKNRIIIEKK